MYIYTYIRIYIYMYVYINIYTYIYDSAPSEGSSLGSEMDNDDLEGGEDDFDYSASLCRCSLCARVSGLFCCRVFCCRVRVRVTCWS